MAARRRKKQKTVWSQDEEDRLLAAVLDYQKDEADEVDLDVVDWDAISQTFPGKTLVQCAQKLNCLHVDDKYFAAIEEIWPVEKWSLKSLRDWDACKASVCREKAPNFERLHLERDRRDTKEFVAAYTGAHLATTTVGESITTVNDDLIPVDIFGQTIAAADKAHLLPKA
jgi:hypothetical protein